MPAVGGSTLRAPASQFRVRRLPSWALRHERRIAGMTRRMRMSLIFGAALLLVIGVIGLLLWPGKPQTVSKATSPDGTWSVEVRANPRLTGSYDIVVYVLDGQGKQLTGGMVVDLTGDLAAARTRHAVTFVDNKTAKAGG